MSERAFAPKTDPWEVVGVVALLCAWLVAMLAPMAGFIPGDLGDGRFNTTILEHLHLWLTGDDRSYSDPGFFAPFKDVIFLSETYTTTFPIYSALRVLGFEPYQAFSLWASIGCLLTSVSGYYVARRLGFGAPTSTFIACAFAYSLPAIAQLGHAQFSYRYAAPLAWFFAYRFALVRDARHLYASISFSCLALLTGFYIGAFTAALCLFAGAGTYFALRRASPQTERPRSNFLAREAWLSLAVCVALTAATAAFLIKQQSVGDHYGVVRDWAGIEPLTPSLSAYLTTVGLPYWDALTGLGSLAMNMEVSLFPGVTVSALVAIGVARALRELGQSDMAAAVAGLGLALAAAALVTLKIGDFSLYRFASELPGVNAIRAPGRYVLVFYWGLALAAGYGLVWLVRPNAPRRTLRLAVAGLLLTVGAYDVLALSRYKTSLAALDAREGAIAERVAAAVAERPDAVLYLGGVAGDPEWAAQLDAMRVIQRLGLKQTLNGYSGWFVDGATVRPECATALRQTVLGRLAGEELREFGARITPVGLGVCPVNLVKDWRPRTATSGPDYTAEIVASTRIAIEGVETAGTEWGAVVRIENNSNGQTMHARSPSPTRLSYRLIGPASADPGWEARVDLPYDLPPGESGPALINGSCPGDCADYVLQVSLVSELRFWFHDVGMSVAACRLEGACAP